MVGALERDENNGVSLILCNELYIFRRLVVIFTSPPSNTLWGFGGEYIKPFALPLQGRDFDLNPVFTLHVKRVELNVLPKVVDFFRVLRFPPTGKVDRVG